MMGQAMQSGGGGGGGGAGGPGGPGGPGSAGGNPDEASFTNLLQVLVISLLYVSLYIVSCTIITHYMPSRGCAFEV